MWYMYSSHQILHWEWSSTGSEWREKRGRREGGGKGEEEGGEGGESTLLQLAMGYMYVDV